MIIAFQDYQPGSPFSDTANWVGLKHIHQFINSLYFERLLVNTLRLSLLQLLFAFWVPIIFALFLNEVTNLRYKKVVQTCSYMPYFVSSVVVAGMAISFLDVNGLINNVLSLFGVEPKEYITDPNAFPAIYTVTTIWKDFGFGSILYFSTLSSIDPALYEASRIDGASHMQQIWHITLPGLLPTIIIMLILRMGSIFSVGYEKIMLMYNPATYETADVISTYVYRRAFESGDYSFSAAVGLFNSVINFTIIMLFNKFSKKISEVSLW